jgi:uncharacterized protein YhbP (UPF0306 family)
MLTLPVPLAEFLHQHSVLSLAVSRDDLPWSANILYAFDQQQCRLLFMSSLDTRHGAILAHNAQVAGSISEQFSDLTQIHGLQYNGIASLVAQPAEAAAALDLYYRRFPQAQGMVAPVWQIRLQHLKFTDNRAVFGAKTLWSRPDPDPAPSRFSPGIS